MLGSGMVASKDLEESVGEALVDEVPLKDQGLEPKTSAGKTSFIFFN